jgi:hypothetical protein
LLGLALGGIGIVPIALLATAISGNWTGFGGLAADGDAVAFAGANGGGGGGWGGGWGGDFRFEI